MKHRLIIHAGMPKTGTSAIQNFLYDNQRELNRFGYCYPDLIKEMNEANINVHCRSEGLSKNGVALGLFRSWKDFSDSNVENNTAWSVLKKIILDHLENYDVIISDEDLWCQGNTYAILRSLKTICPEMKIIAYLRRQDLEIEALWNQVVKRYGYCTISFENAKSRWINGRVIKYLDTLNEMEKIVGLDNMQIRVYEKGQLVGSDGNIIDDFLDCIQINNDNENWIKRKSSNDRLNGSLLNIKLAMNEFLSKEDWLSGIIEEYFMDAITCLETSNIKEGYFSYDERKSILEKFENENRIIAQKYLGREDGRLFLDDISNLPTHSNEISINDVIKIFTYISLEQERKIWKLEQKLNNTISNKYDLLMDGRKVTLFGAGYICRKFCSINCMPISDIIDNDKSKAGTIVNGCIVKHFDEITDWKNRFVIITCNAYNEISMQLKSLGLIYNSDFVIYADNDI